MRIDLSNKMNISESFLSYFLETFDKPSLKSYVRSCYPIIQNSLKNTYESLLENNSNDFDLPYQFSLIKTCGNKYSKMFLIVRYYFLEWLMSINKDVENYKKEAKEYQLYVSKNVMELALFYQDYKTKLMSARTTILDDDFLDKLEIWCRKSPEGSEERYKREFIIQTIIKEMIDINKILSQKENP